MKRHGSIGRGWAPKRGRRTREYVGVAYKVRGPAALPPSLAVLLRALA
jgi:hypothetical protein